MPIINLRKYYYPTIRKDAFVEVSGEVAEALEEGLRIEQRQEKKSYITRFFPWTPTTGHSFTFPSTPNRRRTYFSKQRITLNRSAISPA